MATLVFVLIVVAIYVIVFRYPGVACGLIFASYAIEQLAQATVPLAAAFSPLCNYLTAGAILIALMAQVLRHGLVVFRLRTPGILVLSLLAYCYASLFWSVVPTTTERLLRTHIPYLVVFVGLAPMVIQSVKDVEYAILGLILGASVALLGLIFFGQWQGRSVILLNGMPSNALMISRAAGSLLVAATLTDLVRKSLPKVWPLAAALILFTVLLAFLRSASRGQIIAAISVTLLFTSTRKGRWWVPLLGIGVAGMIASGLLAEEVEVNASRWDPDRLDQDVNQGRLGKAGTLLKFWMNSPPSRIWWGLGSGASQDPRLLGTYPHVVPAEVLAEEGLIGFSIYVAGLFSAAIAYVRVCAQHSQRNRDLILAIAALALYEFLLTLKQGSLFGGASVLLLLVLPGALRVAPGSEKVQECD